MSGEEPRDEPVGVGPLPDPDGHDDLSPTARDLRDALAARAAGVEPADRLEEIRMSTRSARTRTRAWQAVAVAAAVVVVGGGAAAALRGGGGDGSVTTVAASATTPAAATTTPPASTPAASTPPPVSTPPPAAPGRSAAASPAPPSGVATSAARTSAARGPALSAGAARVPVYWVGTGTTRLFREFAPTGGDRDDATNALQVFLGGTASDPDYRTPWSSDPGADVALGGSGADTVYLVNLSPAAATASLERSAAEAAVQQLVYTVTAAAGENAPVRILVDGKAGATVFGSYPLPPTVSRAPQADVQAPAWITSVQAGAGSVTVRGVGSAFEGTLLYAITDAAGAEVARDSVRAGANGTFAEYSFTTALPAGTYTVAVSAPDESGGEGAAPVADTKTFTVS